MGEGLNIKSGYETGTITFGSIEHRAFLTEALTLLKGEVSAKEEEIKELKDRITLFSCVTDIDVKKQNQKRIENQIDIAELAEAEVELKNRTFQMEAFEKELNELVSGQSEEVEAYQENQLNGWLDLQIQIVENEMLRDELNGEDNVAQESENLLALEQMSLATEQEILDSNPANIFDSKLDALTELVFTLRSENTKSGETRNTYFEAAKKLLEKWQKEAEKV